MKNMKNYFYFLLMFLGIVLPYSQFVPWSLNDGKIGNMLTLVAANQISLGVTLDALVAALFLVGFIFFDRSKKVKYAWMPVLSVFVFGIGFAFPFYFYLRDKNNN